MGEEGFKYILSLVVERGREAAKQAKENRDDKVAQGRAMAYWEVLDTIKNRLEVDGQDLKEYGLDFDVDSELL